MYVSYSSFSSVVFVYVGFVLPYSPCRRRVIRPARTVPSENIHLRTFIYAWEKSHLGKTRRTNHTATIFSRGNLSLQRIEGALSLISSSPPSSSSGSRCSHAIRSSCCQRRKSRRQLITLRTHQERIPIPTALIPAGTPPIAPIYMRRSGFRHSQFSHYGR